MSPNQFIEVMKILSKYLDKGMDTGYFCGAEHDIIYFYVDAEQCPEDSEDGQALIELGLHLDRDADGWAAFV